MRQTVSINEGTGAHVDRGLRDSEEVPNQIESIAQVKGPFAKRIE